MYIHTHKGFITMLNKGLRKNNKKKRQKTGKYKLNEMGPLNMKYKKWDKLDRSQRSSYSSVVIKYGYSSESYMEPCRKKQYLGFCVLQKIPR